MSQFLRYSLVGVVNTVVGYAVIFLLMYLGTNPLASNALGYMVGFVLSFVLNRNFTFRSTGGQRIEIIRYLLVFGISYLANFAILLLLIGVTNTHTALAQVLAGVIYFGFSYVLNKYYVFRPPKAD